MSLQNLSHEYEITVKLPSTNENGYQTVIGRRSNTESDVEEFRGIPYGSVPGRWHHSELRENLPSDMFDASSNGPRCCQPSEPNSTDGWQAHLDFPSDVTDSEFDCLNLFIARPSQQTMHKAGLGNQIGHLPVYVYIHGGGYAYGAATDPMWDPARLVSRSVELHKPFIAVNINYRLNIFGFAASSDIIQAQTGLTQGYNFALRDQRVALEWVSRNIAAFGGDPQRITVGGQSAGAVSAHAHVLDAKYSSNQPLIVGAIIQSGAFGVVGPVSVAEAEERWHYLCQHFGAADLPAAERLTKLASIPAQDLIEAVKRAGWGTFPVVQDDLTVSRHEDGDWRVSLKSNTNDNGSAHSITNSTYVLDVLIGDTDVEGSVYGDMFVTKIKSLAQVQSSIMSSGASQSGITDITRCYKLDAEAPVDTIHDHIYSFATDMKFGIAVDRAWHKLSRSPHSKAARKVRPMQYRVQFGNPFNGPNHKVAQHCVDLIYIYDGFHDELRVTDDTRTDQDATDSTSNHALVELLQRDWIDFVTAKKSDMPNPTSGDDLIVYGRDRRRAVVPRDEDKEYQARQVRFEILEKHWKDACKIFNALRLI